MEHNGFEYEVIKEMSDIKVDIYKNANGYGHTAVANMDDGILSVINAPAPTSGAHNSVVVDGAIVRGKYTPKATPKHYGKPQFLIK